MKRIIMKGFQENKSNKKRILEEIRITEHNSLSLSYRVHEHVTYLYLDATYLYVDAT